MVPLAEHVKLGVESVESGGCFSLSEGKGELEGVANEKSKCSLS